MSDHLALANAIEDAGIDRAKAARIATVIFDVIQENVATKADVQGAEARLGKEIVELQIMVAQQNDRIDLVEHRLLTRLAGVAIAVGGILFAVLRLWPPHP